jgi:RNA polymerase sigma-70 factor, ECF subfamily
MVRRVTFMDERGAIQLCVRHQDPVGFEFLVKQYRREAFLHAVTLLGNQEDAADACQESFAKAFAAIPRLKQLEAFYPWFYTILRNCCLNMLRRRKTTADFQLACARSPEEPHQGIAPSELLEQREEQVRVWRALQQLAPECKEILVMKYIEGKRYHEISARLHIPMGTVMSRLYNARKSFRDSFVRMNPDAQNSSKNCETRRT